MASRGKRKGDDGELEVQALFRTAGFTRARRALGAGRKDDVGDIDGLRDLCLQVTRAQNGTARIWQKLPQLESQRSNRRTRFGALFIRYDRKPWIVILTPAQFIRLYRYALKGLDAARKERAATMASDDHNGRRPRTTAL